MMEEAEEELLANSSERSSLVIEGGDDIKEGKSTVVGLGEPKPKRCKLSMFRVLALRVCNEDGVVGKIGNSVRW